MLITCTNCQAKIRVPDSAAGKRGKCPKCNTVIAIPAAEEAAEPPAGAVKPASSGSPFDFGEGGEPEEETPPAGRKSGTIADEVADGEPEEVDEKRPRDKTPKQQSQVLSIVSLVLGCLSLLCSCGSCSPGAWCTAGSSLVLSIGAIVTGMIGMKKGGKPLALVGMSTGGAGVLLSIVGVVLYYLVVAAWLAGGGVAGFKGFN